MSTVGLWLLSASLAALTAGAAGGLKERLGPRARARAAARRVPSARIGLARPGELVRVEGRLEAPTRELVAPFSGRSCAHYEAAVEHKRGRSWRRVAEGAEGTGFFVRDETGRAEVDLSGAWVDVVIDHLWPAHELDAERRFELEQFLVERGLAAGPALSAHATRLRYCEGALEAGEIVTVVGVASRRRGGQAGAGYRDEGACLVLTAPRGGRLFVSDGLHYG